MKNLGPVLFFVLFVLLVCQYPVSGEAPGRCAMKCPNGDSITEENTQACWYFDTYFKYKKNDVWSTKSCPEDTIEIE